MRVACVIPAFNVAHRLEAVAADLEGKIDQLIIVDDGSVDATGEQARKLRAEVLTHHINRGQGAALKTGTVRALESGADIIVHFDGDGQFRASDIERLTAPLRRGEADVVFGSRFLDNTTEMPAFKRKVIIPLARLVNRWLFGIRTTDPQSGFRAFTRQAAAHLDWEQDRMAHCSEILVAAHRPPLRVSEVPITVIYHEFGQRLGGGLKILRDTLLAKLVK